MTTNITRRSQDAQQFYSKVFSPAYELLRQAARRTPLVIMLWGPRQRSRSWTNKRLQIREDLRRLGHTVYFSEQLGVPSTALTKKGIEFLQSEAVDVIVAMQNSYDPIGGVHHFVELRVVDAKMVLFVDQAAPDARLYHRALIELEDLYRNVETFKYPDDLVRGRVQNSILEKISTLQMVKYRATQRAKTWGLKVDDTRPGGGPLQPFRYNLLELYREHRDEIDVLTDPISLFFLAYVNQWRRIPVKELTRDVGLTEDSLLQELALLFRGEMMMRSEGILSVTAFGRRIVDGLGLVMPAGQVIRPQPQPWLGPGAVALASGAGLSLAGAALFLVTLFYGMNITQNQQPLVLTPAPTAIASPAHIPLPPLPTPTVNGR